MRTNEEVVSAIMADLKSQTTLTTALGSEIRENQWQGQDFLYPAVRIYADVYPTINNCGPERVKAVIEVFSEQKSSQECQHIMGLIQTIYHRRSFTSNGLKFVVSIVTEGLHPTKSIYAWEGRVNIDFLVN